MIKVIAHDKKNCLCAWNLSKVCVKRFWKSNFNKRK